jgi:hypothetical protein
METGQTICRKYVDKYESDYPVERNPGTANAFLESNKEAIMNDLKTIEPEPTFRNDHPKDIQRNMAYQNIVDQIKKISDPDNGFG